MCTIIWSGQRQCIGVKKEECSGNPKRKSETGCSRDRGKNPDTPGASERSTGKITAAHGTGPWGAVFIPGHGANTAVAFSEPGYCFFCTQKTVAIDILPPLLSSLGLFLMNVSKHFSSLIIPSAGMLAFLV